MTGHILLIDGLNMVRRIYGANPAPDSPEKAEGAIKSTRSSFRRALDTHKPTHVLWTFDFGGKNWRHELFEDYKLTRSPMPEALVAPLAGFKQELVDKGWAVATIPGFEAEDTMASGALIARGRGMDVTALTNDKDALTLMKHGVTVYDHFAKQVMDDAYCLKKFGVPGYQVIEVLALLGDSTDNVPGVDGIGVKTAAKLIQEFGDVARVLDAAPSIKGANGARLVEQREQALLSRRLVELRYDVFDVAGMPFDLASMELGQSL